MKKETCKQCKHIQELHAPYHDGSGWHCTRDNCVSPDKNSEQYKMLWDDRAEIKGRISKLEKDGGCCVCGEEAVAQCSCKTLYCNEHYKTTVMTGNCCRDNEREME